MVLHSLHTLAKLTLKETVPLQSRTSPYVTVKNIYIQYSEFRTSASCSKILSKKYIEYSEKFQGKCCFSG